jgi:hypothetical protein
LRGICCFSAISAIIIESARASAMSARKAYLAFCEIIDLAEKLQFTGIFCLKHKLSDQAGNTEGISRRS